jgi:superfamily II DNA or RNA helicase
MIDDQRFTVAAQISFTGQLRGYSATFCQSCQRCRRWRDGGGYSGSGKTVSGIALAAQLQQRCLILVKSKDLANQWRKAIEQFTGLIAGLIGAYSGST